MIYILYGSKLLTVGCRCSASLQSTCCWLWSSLEGYVSSRRFLIAIDIAFGFAYLPQQRAELPVAAVSLLGKGGWRVPWSSRLLAGFQGMT
jgi:hypothetical protein